MNNCIFKIRKQISQATFYETEKQIDVQSEANKFKKKKKTTSIDLQKKVYFCY